LRSKDHSVADSHVLQYIYAILFGFSGAGFIALWARMGLLFGELEAPTVFGALCFGRGLGSIVAGPISSALLAAGNEADFARITTHWAGVAGGRWRGVIACTGTVMLLTTLLLVIAWCCWIWQERATEIKEWLQRRWRKDVLISGGQRPESMSLTGLAMRSREVLARQKL
jgi:hypothetical protein